MPNIDVKLPNLGDGIKSGDILEVLIKEGETIKKDQGIVEVETDKASVEVPSSHSGKVVKIHVKAGQSVDIGGTLLTLEVTEGAAAPAKAAPAAPSAKAPAQPAPAKPEPAKPEPVAEAPKPSAPAKAAPAPAAPKPVAAKVAAPAPAVVEEEEAVDDGEVAAGPAVRRFAREVGVDLHHVPGTGPGNRITRDDVLNAVRQASSRPAAGAATPAKASNSQSDAWGPVRLEKMSKIRKVIAQKMHESWTTCPRVTNFDDADITELEKIRSSSKDDYAKAGIKLTSLPFIVKACAMALKNHPTVNAMIDSDNEQIVYKEYVNIGIAVDSDRGLVVPSLRGVDHLSIPEVARGIANLAEKVRDSNFGVDDLRGSTFTISNLGAIGGTYSTPIINYPEVAILLVGRARKLPIVTEGDKIEVRLMLPLSLSYDHRLIDGATAARFLNDVMSYLKAPGRLLLAP
ncbi:MAG TPA: 2-oxo acid dehydrogenase subunit E2 [Pirellulaceae bacterium]|nr:2-oxo acid dehydrogenase subunit E2 [Pirellulaceae bacterium]